LSLALPDKGPVGRLKFYRLVERDILLGRLLRQPTEGEIDEAIAIARSKEYDQKLADWEIELIHRCVLIFENAKRQKFASDGQAPMFPMEFKECLRRIIGGRSVGDRVHLFRHHWAAMLERAGAGGFPPRDTTEEERINKANEMIEKFTIEGVPEDWFTSLSNSYPTWRIEQKSKNIRQQRSGAAKVRWLKENSQKTLGASQGQND